MKKLVKAGDVRRSETEAMVQTLLERGRETATHMAGVVQAEVARQLGWLANRVDDVEDQLEAIVSRFAPGGPAASPAAPTKKAPAKKAPAEKAAAKKAPAKKTAAKKTAAKKAPAKKTAAKKAGGEEDRRQEGAGQEGRRHVGCPQGRDGPAGLSGGPSAPRRRARPTGPRHQPHRRPGRRRCRAGARERRRRRQAGAARRGRATRSSSTGPPARFVGRAGEKLDAALDGVRHRCHRPRRPRRRRVDGRLHRLPPRPWCRPGSSPSTSGHGQLHPRIRGDPRVARPRANQRPRRHAGDDRRPRRCRRRGRVVHLPDGGHPGRS